jgi:CRP/FNR family transcriptional regulator, cyclic AMP receptor protein
MSQDTYEGRTREEHKNGVPLQKLDIPLLKYFWQAGPFVSSRAQNVPKFLRKIEVFKNFTDFELMILSRYLHLRKFENKEIIFNQSDTGIGFYMIYSGHVDIVVERDQVPGPENDDRPASDHIVTLEKFDHFGELALLQENSVRNATAIAKESCAVLGIFRPDVDELINEHPITAAKLLQSISFIIANRLFSLTNEVRRLKYRINQLESGNEKRPRG